MSELMKKPNRGQFAAGRSGNPAGRKPGGTSASEINRGFMRRYGSWERLARVAAGQNVLTDEEQAERIAKGKAPFPDPTMNEVLKALQLQTAYGYGQPTANVDGIEGVLAGPREMKVTINYVEKQLVQNFDGSESEPRQIASGSDERSE